MSNELSIASEIATSAQAAWLHATSLAGVSWELAPWLRMTMPRGLDEASFRSRMNGGEVELPVTLGRSWLLRLGWLPVDYDRIGVAEVEPGRRFLERSTMASMSAWQHERTVEPLAASACRVTDRLAWTPRPLVPSAVAAVIVRAVFTHRHARLRARFGTASA